MDSRQADGRHLAARWGHRGLLLALLALIIGGAVMMHPADDRTRPVRTPSARPDVPFRATPAGSRAIAVASVPATRAVVAPTPILPHVTRVPDPTAVQTAAPSASPLRANASLPPASATPILPSPTPDLSITAYAFAGNALWVATHTTLFHTPDAGRHWTAQLTIHAPAGWEVPLIFVDTRHGWIVSDGYLQATTDGGQHWVRQYPVGAYPMSVSFVSTRQGWIVLDRNLLATADGGHTWRLVASNYPVANAWFFDAQHGWSFLNKVEPNPEFYYSADGGKTWLPRPLPPCRWYKMRGEFVPSGPRSAWVACNPDSGSSVLASLDLYRTTDGGQTWVRLKSLANIRDNPNLTWIGPPFFLDDHYGWVELCCAKQDGTILLYRTTDGGRTWESNPGGFGGIRFASPTRGYAVAGATLLGTQDGGRHWSVLYSPSSMRGSP